MDIPLNPHTAGTRVLAIGLDGYEESVERELIAAGELPAIARLREQSAAFLLDHGVAQRTGLTWEQFSTGLSPQQAGRWAAVHFDPQTYSVWQEGTRTKPFAANLDCQTVVFDAPYFDMEQAEAVHGLVGWGAHDPGVPLSAHPRELLEEFEARFGPYPATEWIYGQVWQSVSRTREMGNALAKACELRARAARWLLKDRMPDWDLAIVVVSEPHSALEALWHGLDPSHPLHNLPSAGPAREGIVQVYRAVDRLVADLAADFPECALMVFSMGGMGPNQSDLPSMMLLPELLYRHHCGQSFYRQPENWIGPETTSMLAENAVWHETVNANFPVSLKDSINTILAKAEWNLRNLAGLPKSSEMSHMRISNDWIPASYYRRFWHQMKAFALPSYYDGRIRINLAGREKHGLVKPDHYHQELEELETLLRNCRDPFSGEAVVGDIEYTALEDPRHLGATEGDMVVVWNHSFSALEHPALGRVGPVPTRRTGGHTGKYGMAYLRNTGLAKGDHGVRSSFDLVPTLIELLNESRPEGLSGESLLPRASTALHRE